MNKPKLYELQYGSLFVWAYPDGEVVRAEAYCHAFQNCIECTNHFINDEAWMRRLDERIQADLPKDEFEKASGE